MPRFLKNLIYIIFVGSCHHNPSCHHNVPYKPACKLFQKLNIIKNVPNSFIRVMTMSVGEYFLLYFSRVLQQIMRLANDSTQCYHAFEWCFQLFLHLIQTKRIVLLCILPYLLLYPILYYKCECLYVWDSMKENQSSKYVLT